MTYVSLSLMVTANSFYVPGMPIHPQEFTQDGRPMLNLYAQAAQGYIQGNNLPGGDDNLMELDELRLFLGLNQQDAQNVMTIFDVQDGAGNMVAVDRPGDGKLNAQEVQALLLMVDGTHSQLGGTVAAIGQQQNLAQMYQQQINYYNGLRPNDDQDDAPNGVVNQPEIDFFRQHFNGLRDLIHHHVHGLNEFIRSRLAPAPMPK